MSNETPIDKPPKLPDETWQQYNKRNNRYLTREGRSWLRKSDPIMIQPEGAEVIVGLQAIAKYLGISYYTLRKYIKHHNLPVFTLGDSTYRTFPVLLHNWAIAAYNSLQSLESDRKSQQLVSGKGKEN